MRTTLRPAGGAAVLLLMVACTGTGGTGRPLAGTGPPAATGLRGLIAYSTQSGNIWVMHADGSGRHRVTSAGDHDVDPSLSPDGQQVVFRTSRGHYRPDPDGTGAEGILVASVDNSHQREIQPGRGGLFPAWSPGGRRIALSTLRADDTETIITMAVDGSHIRDTGAAGECSAWSPDSARIAYCHHGRDGNFGGWVMDADGRHQRRLTRFRGNDYPAAWSADGRRIVFASQRAGSFDVWVMNADGSGQTRLTRGADEESPDAWLPDGRIVYSSFRGDAPLPNWYLIQANGTGIRSLPQLRGAADPIDWLVNAG